MNPLDELVAMFTDNLPHARRIARLHALDDDGRCKTCYSTGVSSGRTFGCTLGSAARTVLQST